MKTAVVGFAMMRNTARRSVRRRPKKKLRRSNATAAIRVASARSKLFYQDQSKKGFAFKITANPFFFDLNIFVQASGPAYAFLVKNFKRNAVAIPLA
jgi:hypothetical protein